MTRLLSGLILAVVAMAFGAPAASAGTVFHTPGSATINYNAPAGEANVLTVSVEGDFYVFRDEAPIVRIGDCTGPTPAEPDTVRCDIAGITLIQSDLNDLGDRATLGVPIATLVFGRAGEDTLLGGPGPDELVGGPDVDTAAGGAGDDSLAGEEFGDDPATSANTLDGGPGQDVLEGGGGADTADGGPGNDLAVGFGGADRISGGDGVDELSGGDGNDELRGDGGNDVLGTDQRIGIEGRSSERGDDLLDGGEGDDELRPGLGPDDTGDADRLEGGPGRDRVSYSLRDARVELSLDAAANDGAPGERDDIRPGVERVAGGAGDDLMSGGPAPDELDGGVGNDTIDGGPGDDSVDGGAADAGNDDLRGAAGRDVLTGNAGNDVLRGGDDNDQIAGGGDADDAGGDAGDDTITGGPGRDALAGGDGADRLNGSVPALVGEDGGDALDGGAGADTLDGGPGNDRLTGGPGVDDFNGGTGRDRALYEDKRAAVAVTLDGLADDGVRGENDNVKPDVEDVGGGGQEDTFTGSTNANVLDAGSGEDYADGAGGSGDDLLGGRDRDVLRARDRKRDVVDCGSGGGADFAIVDRIDVVRRCERRDTGTSKPRVGRQVVIRPIGTRVEFGVVGMRRTVPLKDRIGVPVRSKVDATIGRVRLTAAAGTRGRQQGTFREGAFVVAQRVAARRAVTELRLTGGDFARCRAGASSAGPAGAAQRRKRTVRRLFGTAKGRFRTRGRYSAAAVRGTTWQVFDRCDGTLTVVRSGVVRVTDFRRNRTITLRAGQRYLARAPR